MKCELVSQIVRADKFSGGGFISGLLVNAENIPCSGAIQIPLNEKDYKLFEGVNSTRPKKLKITIETIE